MKDLAEAGRQSDLEHGRLSPIGDLCYRKTGKRPSPQCIWRWRTQNGLEAVFIQGTWQTTEAAFLSFIQRQTERRTKRPTNIHSETSRSAETEQRLKSAGLL